MRDIASPTPGWKRAVNLCVFRPTDARHPREVHRILIPVATARADQMFEDIARKPVLDELYHQFLVSENSAEFIHGVAQSYNLASLHKIASTGNRISRRGAVLAIGFLGDYASNGILGEALKDDDRAVRLLADHGIRQLWLRLGNPALESRLRKLVRLNQQERFEETVEQATLLIESDDQFAEVWNQRAIALYHLEDFSHSVCDCRQALDLNRYHFLSALGSANGHLELGDVFEALVDFRTALDINPDLDMVRSQINHLERIVDEG